MSSDGVLLVAALVLELVASFNPTNRINLVAAGLACYFASLVF